MPYAILRAAKLKTPGNIASSVSHTFRNRETLNADPSLTPENEHLGVTSAEEVTQGITARLPEKRRSDAVLAIEYFVGVSPEAFKDGTFTDGGKKYFSNALDWLKDRHGAENVISAHIHRDETTPHMVVYVVPRDGDKLNAKKWLGGKAKLSEMQSKFAFEVGMRNGLDRGIEGSKAQHKTIKQFYGEMGQAAKVDVPTISAAEVTPQRFKAQSFTERIGLTRVEESPEMVADRLTAKIDQAVRPVVTKLRDVTDRERQQAKAAAKVTKALTDLREKVAPFLELLDVSASQFTHLAHEARRIVQEARQAKAQAETLAKAQARAQAPENRPTGQSRGRGRH